MAESTMHIMRHYPATSNLPFTPRSSLKCTRPEQNSIKISLITVAALTQQRPELAGTLHSSWLSKAIEGVMKLMMALMATQTLMG